MQRGSHSERIRAATREWVESRLGVERRQSSSEAIVAFVVALLVTGVAWWGMAFLIYVIGWIFTGMTAGTARFIATAVLLLIVGAYAARRFWWRGETVEPGRWEWIPGPGLAFVAWDKWRRYQDLLLIDTLACAEVTALLVERGAKIAFEELEQLKPHLSMGRLRRDLLLFEGMRIWPGPPPAVSLAGVSADEINALLGRQAAPAAADALSA